MSLPPSDPVVSKRSDAPSNDEDAQPESWAIGALSKVRLLVAARIGSQAIGVAWFLVVARLFSKHDLGILSAGLVTFAAVSVVGDIGTTWSIAREATSAPGQALYLYREGLKLRIFGVACVGSATLAVGALFADRSIVIAMALGVVIALVSGVSEIGMATLRSVASVRFEGLAMPGERLLFVGLAAATVKLGFGPLAILGSYLTSNMVTAGLAWREIRLLPGSAERDVSVRLWGSETRRVGVAFALMALGPRANGMVLVLLVSQSEIADYTIATRPLEQVALALFGFSTALLPLLRHDHEARRRPEIRIGSMAAAVVVIMMPAVVLAIVSARDILSLLYGQGRYLESDGILMLTALLIIIWPIRGLIGMLMVVREEASVAAWIASISMLINLGVTVVATLLYGAIGAAITLILAEALTLAALLQRSGISVPEQSRGPLSAALLIGVAAGASGKLAPLQVAIVLSMLATLVAASIVVHSAKAASRNKEVVW